MTTRRRVPRSMSAGIVTAAFACSGAEATPPPGNPPYDPSWPQPATGDLRAHVLDICGPSLCDQALALVDRVERTPDGAFVVRQPSPAWTALGVLPGDALARVGDRPVADEALAALWLISALDGRRAASVRRAGAEVVIREQRLP